LVGENVYGRALSGVKPILLRLVKEATGQPILKVCMNWRWFLFQTKKTLKIYCA